MNDILECVWPSLESGWRADRKSRACILITYGDKMKHFLLLLAILFPIAAVHADNELDVFDAPVHSIVSDGQYLYVGGEFSRYSRPYGGWVGITAGETAPSGTLPRVCGNVYKTIDDGSGGYYIGGMFNCVGNNFSIKNLAHILADGSLDSTWTPNPNSLVFDLLLDGTTLYVAGGFCTIASTSSHCGLASFDMSSGALTAWNPRLGGGYQAAFALVTGSSGGTRRLYVGGNFELVDEVSHGNIAAFDLGGALPVLDASFIPSFNRDVRALVFDSTARLIVGGTFDEFTFSTTTYTRVGLARINAINGSDTAFDAQLDAGSRVYTLAIDSANALRLYIGGNFSTVASTSRNSAAEINLSNAALLPWNPPVSLIVNSLVHSDGYVYIGGSFTSVDGTSQNYIAKVHDGSYGDGTGTLAAWDPGPFQTVQSLFMDGSGTLLIGGSFSGMSSDRSVQNLAKIDLGTGQVDPLWNPLPDSTVYDLALKDETLFVAGAFSNLGISGRRGLAAVNKTSGAIIDTGVFKAGLNSTGLSLALDGTTLYVGGAFTQVTQAGGSPAGRTYAASVNADTGDVVSSFAPVVGDIVRKVYPEGDSVYLGGDFTSVNLDTRNHLAEVKKSDGSNTTFDPDVTGTSVYALASTLSSGGYLFVGGVFSDVHGESHGNLAAVAPDGSPLSSFTPDPDSDVTALYILNGTLYAGGGFYSIAGQGLGRYKYLAAFTLADLSLDTSFEPLPNYGITSLGGYQQKIWGGGYFYTIGSLTLPYQGLALFQAMFGNVAPPSVPAGVVFPGNQLSSDDNGTWDAIPPVSFEKTWLRCDGSGAGCQTIDGASGDYYTLTSSDLGDTIRVRVDATGQNGAGSADSQPTDVIGGTPTPTTTPSPSPTAAPSPTTTPASTVTPTPRDVLAPRVKARRSRGTAHAKAVLRYTVSDGSGMSRENIRIYRGKKTAVKKATKLSPIPAKGKKSVKVSTKRLARGKYSFCVVAQDASRNTSKRSCSKLKLR